MHGSSGSLEKLHNGMCGMQCSSCRRRPQTDGRRRSPRAKHHQRLLQLKYSRGELAAWLEVQIVQLEDGSALCWQPFQHVERGNGARTTGEPTERQAEAAQPRLGSFRPCKEVPSEAQRLRQHRMHGRGWPRRPRASTRPNRSRHSHGECPSSFLPAGL